jgi:hypothetical protein
LDDLKQEPLKPVEIDPSYTDSVASFFKTHDSESDQVDPTVIDRINLAMNPYRTGTNAFARSDYLPSVVGQTAISQQTPTEINRLASSDINLLRNLEVVKESDYPVMFFYLTCRHKYREVEAPFSYDRAYFVGIREIAFTRDSYTVAYDNDHYIEPSGDLLNTERNDFTQDNGILVV